MTIVRGVLLMGIVALLAVGAWGQSDDSVNVRAERMTEAAKDFLSTLDREGAGKAAFEFENTEERKDWSNLPARVHPRNGLSFGEMTEAQRSAAHRLFETGLSTQGYAKAFGVMRLDDVWSEIVEQRRPGGGAMFGSGKYWVALFGDPDTGGVWGWQFDGHHMAVNVTSVKGEVNVMPMFFGAEPDVVPSGAYAGWRIFGAERYKALALARSLTKKQRKTAVLSEEIPAAIFTGPGQGEALTKFEGIEAAALSESQRKLLWALIDEYIGNEPVEAAQAHRERIVQDGNDALHFAWMGPMEDDSNLYYRVHGPSIIIEYDNTFVGPRTGGYSNHIHTVLREPSNDFGEDLLRRHYRESEHHRER